MRLSISKLKLNEFLITLFTVITVVFPADIYNLKKISFMLICLINIRTILKSTLTKKNSMLTFFGLVFPILLIVYSSIITQEIMISISRSFSAFLFLIIFVIRKYDIDFERILIRSVEIIMFGTLLLVVLDLVGFASVNNSLFRNEIMYGYGIGIMGKSRSYPFYYKVFFKTSPLIVISLFKYFDESKYIKVMIAVIALILSGTRANVLFPFVFLMMFYLIHSNKSKNIKFIYTIAAVSLSLVLLPNIVSISNEVFIEKGMSSDLVRIGHLKGVVELLDSNPLIVFLGTGMGSEFYSYGRNAYISSMEWSYIDLWRQMGFGFFFLFIVFIGYPFLKRYEIGEFKKYSYISFLLIAATNPLLFSSTAYLVYIYMYYDIKTIKKQEGLR